MVNDPSIPDWPDRFIVKATLKRRDRELSNAFRSEILLLLDKSDFYEHTKDNFETIFGELVLNGFSHGCEKDDDTITLRVVFFGIGVTLEVTNDNRGKRIVCSVHDIQKELENLDDHHGRGRGLAVAYSLADQFDILDEGRTVKVALYDAASATERLGPDITAIHVGDYLGNFVWKVQRELSRSSGNVVLAFSKPRGKPPSASSLAIRTVEEHRSISSFAVVIDRGMAPLLPSSIRQSPKFIGYFDSIETAVEAIKSR